MALVIGVPMDFRLGFGGSFGDDTQLDRDRVGAGRSARTRARWRRSCTAAWPATLDALRAGAAGGPDRVGAGSNELRAVENEKRAAEQDDLDGRARAAPPDARVRRAGAGARPRTPS